MNKPKTHNSGFIELVNQAKKKIKETTVNKVAEKLKNKERFFLIDVREDREWAQGHLPQAVHLGKGVIERDIEAAIPDHNSEIILYCGGGYRSALAALSLEQMGYKNVISMDGGFRDWVEKGYPVASVAPIAKDT